MEESQPAEQNRTSRRTFSVADLVIDLLDDILVGYGREESERGGKSGRMRRSS